MRTEYNWNIYISTDGKRLFTSTWRQRFLNPWSSFQKPLRKHWINLRRQPCSHYLPWQPWRKQKLTHSLNYPIIEWSPVWGQQFQDGSQKITQIINFIQLRDQQDTHLLQKGRDRYHQLHSAQHRVQLSHLSLLPSLQQKGQKRATSKNDRESRNK